MMAMIWIYATVALLVSEAWSTEKETNQSTPVNNTSRSLLGVRHLAFNLGSDANVTCSNKTWNETIYVIWNIYLTDKHCKLSFSTDGRSEDTCNDGKSLRNTSTAQSYLHIPNFSNDDEGSYNCELIYRGGGESLEINVAITVPPVISGRLWHKDNKVVAVCRAERGKPAANISWSHSGNSSVEMQLDSNGFFTVESHLELLDGEDTENLSCIVRHPYWREKHIFLRKSRQGYLPWLGILFAVVLALFVAGFIFFAHKKLTLRCCHQSITSPSKSLHTENVDEVEPYASYVQRVNSIYNSSADLFT